MGHKGIRDGGPPRRSDFRPEQVVGLPVKRALIELAHHGFHADLLRADDGFRDLQWLENRVWLAVADGLVTAVRQG